MSFVQVMILAAIQGLAELLPVSSSAHVVVAEKLMGLNPSSPQMTLLLVMLHTGTMFAVIAYFWKRWRGAFFESAQVFKNSVILLFVATALTGIVGEAIIKLFERFWFHSAQNAEIEQLFSHLELIAPALAVGGILIFIAGIFEKRSSRSAGAANSQMDSKQAGIIGIVQGLCLPFRGFSRSGATISVGMLSGVEKMRAEDFSFALAIVLTPVVDVREALRLIKAEHLNGSAGLASALVPSLVGAACAFLAGLLALKWLSRWLETGRWYLFGIYCLVAAGAVAALHFMGY